MNSVSIYVHWPFCLSLCPYCDFNSHIANSIDHSLWLKSYIKELDYFAPNFNNKEVKSIFFGGGTPSLMKPFVVEGIINKISSLSRLSDSCEITLEANPTSFETEKFKEFKIAGINRVSIGIQSFNSEDLLMLGRKHSSSDAINAVKEGAKIFDRYSFDLIYARPGQSLKSWQDELSFAYKLSSGHISLYQLTIEKGTPFFNLYRSNKLHLPSNDLSADLYKWTDSFLNDENYNRYEISNYAKLGQECVHNLCYWNYEEYIGIGPGGHSRIHKTLNDQVKIFAIMMYHKPDKWLESVAISNNGIQNRHELSVSEIVAEALMMGTRLSRGFDEKRLVQLLNLDFASVLNIDVLNHYIQNGFVTVDNNILKLSNSGILLHNYLIPRLIASL